jgi:hypothetical protein
MRVLLGISLLLCSVLFFFSAAGAQDGKKEVTLKGKITCAKCDLGVEAACATVVVVKEDKKDVVYYFDPKGHKKFHSAVCTDSKAGSVTGVVSEENKKKTITVSDVKYD